jgi:hypothetical protein
MTAIAAALATRFDRDIRTVRINLSSADIEEWGKVRRVDSDAGDTMHASTLVPAHDGTRDATFVRVRATSLFVHYPTEWYYMQYEMLLDRFARQARRQPEYELRTFYGQLQHIYVVQFKEPRLALGLDEPTTVFLAAIRTCILDNPDTQLQGLDVQFYSKEGGLDVVDITSLQCLVGRIRDRAQWAIIDRSGSLARASYRMEDA